MRYNGYEIQKAEITLPYGGKSSSYAIYTLDGEMIAYTDCKETAKRYIDKKLRGADCGKECAE